MLRFKILASVVPLLAAAVFARSEIGSVSHPCIALGDTSVELTSLFWTAGVHVAFVLAGHGIALLHHRAALVAGHHAMAVMRRAARQQRQRRDRRQNSDSHDSSPPPV